MFANCCVSLGCLNNLCAGSELIESVAEAGSAESIPTSSRGDHASVFKIRDLSLFLHVFPAVCIFRLILKNYAKDS